MEILIGTPIVLIYEHGTCRSNEQLYYLGRHVYGWLTENGFEAAGLIDDAKYIVPYQHWNNNYMKLDNHNKIDRNRFKNGYDYDDFLVDRVIDVDDGKLNEYDWWHEKTKPSIERIINFYTNKS